MSKVEPARRRPATPSRTFRAGESFEVSADSSFKVEIDGVADYCCSYG